MRVLHNHRCLEDNSLASQDPKTSQREREWFRYGYYLSILDEWRADKVQTIIISFMGRPTMALFQVRRLVDHQAIIVAASAGHPNFISEYGRLLDLQVLRMRIIFHNRCPNACGWSRTNTKSFRQLSATLWSAIYFSQYGRHAAAP